MVRFFTILFVTLGFASSAFGDLLESELIFKPNERFPSSHCSDIEVLPNGDLFVVWFAGSKEKSDRCFDCLRAPEEE